MLYASIRRIAARNLLATLIAITILIGIPSSGHAQDSGAFATHQDVAQPGRRTETSSSSDRLRSLIDEALSRSPIVLAARSHWQAQTKVPIQAATIPDPQVSLQHFTVGSPQPFSGYESSDFYYTGFGVSQDIPGPGKLRLQKSEAEKDADYAKRRYEAAERAVEEKVKEIYFELFYHAKTLAILDRNQEELRQIQQIIRNQVSPGTGFAAGLDQGAAPNHRDPEGARDAPSGGRPGTARSQADPRARSRLAEYQHRWGRSDPSAARFGRSLRGFATPAPPNSQRIVRWKRAARKH